MTVNSFLRVALSFILISSLLPSVAFAAPASGDAGVSDGLVSNDSTSSGGSASGEVGDSAENAASTPNGSSGTNGSGSAQDAAGQGSLSEEPVSSSYATGEQAELLEPENDATIEDGQYLLAPTGNSSLIFECSTSKLASMNAPRSNVVTIAAQDADGITIQNNSGDYLTAHGSSVMFEAQNNSDSQVWYVQKSKTGGYIVRSASAGTVLDISGGKINSGIKVGLYAANGTAAQNWTFNSVSSVLKEMDDAAKASMGLLDESATYYIETALADNKVADVAAGSKSNGANVQLYALNKSGAQQWRVNYDAGGYVTFTNIQSGKVLDVAAGKAVAGANVQQYEGNGSYAQKWIVSKNEDGTYAIRSALWSGLSLDLTNAGTANQTNIRLYSVNGTSAQGFNLLSDSGVYAGLDARAAQNVDALPDGTYLINTSLDNSKVLDVASGSMSNAANVQLYQSNMTEAQQWEVSHDEKGYVTFRNIRSGKVLDVKSASVADKANVQQYENNGSLAQKWIVSRNENGTYSIESALWKNISLDISVASTANGANIQIYTKNGTVAQSFRFIDAKPQVDPCEDFGLENRYFNIASVANDSYVVDIAGASASNGANVQLYSANKTYAQLFTFQFVETEAGKGYYYIINAKSGKVLNIDGGNLVNGTNIHQWDKSATGDNDLFSVLVNEDGSYSFISKATGLSVDVSGGTPKNGANIQGYAPNGSIAQNFKLVEVSDLLQEGVVSLYSALSSTKVVDVTSGSMESGANVQIYSTNGSLAQKWNVTKVGDNTYTLQSIRSGMNLAVGGNGNVYQESPSGAANQQWIPFIQKGYTGLKNVETGKVLDIASASTANGANVQVYDANGSNAQLFDIKQVAILSSGTYVVQAFENSNFALDVANASTANGANIQLYKDNDSNAQKWNIVRNSDGSYTFKNAANGKALDLASAKAEEGVNIQQWTSNNSAAQKWNLQYVNGGGIQIVSAVDKNFVMGIAGNAFVNGSNIELQSSSTSVGQRFTFEPTRYIPPLPADQLAMYNRISGMSSGTSWLIAVDRSTHKVGVFKGSSNYWSLQYYWSCTTGAPSSPTITGTYRTTGFKRSTLSTDSRARSCTQIWGGYFFHSILASNNELGKSLSHGCIRLQYSSAQWIYNNIGVGTTVVIYN